MNGDPSQESDVSAPKQEVRGLAWMKKTVLLVDLNPQTRDSRAKIMRTLGVTVDSVSSARAARLRLDSARYNLVLVDLGRDVEGAESLARQIRLANPRQLVAFLVGSPLFVATSLSGKDTGATRVVPARTAAPKPITNPPAVAAFDFGLRIKKAEADAV